MKIGSVTELGPERWWARGPRPGRISLGVYPTREEAEDVRAAAAQEMARADGTRMAGVTLRAFGGRVLAERERSLPRSRKADKSRWQHIAAAPFVEDPIATLTAPQVDRWVKGVARKVPGSARYVLALLSSICGQAVREGHLVANPCAEIRAPRAPRTFDPWTYLLLEEQDSLLEVDAPETDLLQIGFLLGTGVRDGEMFALRLRDVHLEVAHPHIVVRFGSFNGPTKGKKIRSVPLFGRGLRSLRRWLEVLPSYCPKNPHGLVFPGPAGGRQHSGQFLLGRAREEGREVVVDRFRLHLEAAGIVAEHRHDGRPVRPHDLRHTYAASLVSGWWGPTWRLEDICAVMGHSDITVTQRYAHLAPGRLQELAALTGLQPGDGPRGIVRGSSDVSRSDRARALRAVDEHRVFRDHEAGAVVADQIGQPSPVLSPEQAIEILRALERNDLEGARRAEGSRWGEAELCRLAEAALQAPSGKERAG